MKKSVVASLLASVFALAACQTNTQGQNQAIGAATGAVLGGVLGKQVSGGKRGVVVGAALGGAFGYLAGSRVKVTEQADGSVKLDIPGSVLFATDSATINPSFQATLDDIAGTLNQHPDTVVSVVGHTDSRGAADYNMRLSQNRANSVSSYLKSRGVAAARISAAGQGEEMPVADNSTEQGRAQNRRVEMFVRPAGS